MTKSINAEKQRWYTRNLQSFTEFFAYLASSTETHLCLSTHGLLPVESLTTKAPLHRVMEIAIPVRCGQTLQWRVSWQSQSKITQIFLRLGTGNRINHCHLVLSVFCSEQLDLLATAQVIGTTVQDNQWATFALSQPLPVGEYICQLNSPDADNTLNTLFLWLTVAGLTDYCYFPLPHHLVEEKYAQCTQHPLLSILIFLPTEINETDWQTSLDSISEQYYPHWQLWVVTERVDCSPLKQGHWIVIDSDQSVAEAYNLALAQAEGEYTMILAPGDMLANDAFVQIIVWLNQATAPVDMLYSDEDKVNAGNVYYDPFFKPDWAADMLRGQFYTGQLGVYRTQLLKEIGGFRDCAHLLWDMVLRLTEHTTHIQHLPKVLYHRRQSTTPIQKAITVVQSALDREQQGGLVTIHRGVGLVHYPVKKQPLVSIIIPTRDMAEMLEHCLASLCQGTTYPHWEIILIDNGSQESATQMVFNQYQQRLKAAFTLSQLDIPFNFSRLVNHGVNLARGEFIFLLNNDMWVLSPHDWLQILLGFAQHPKIGCVSSKLLYPDDDTIQHAGLILGLGGIANPGHRHFYMESSGYFNRLNMVVNCSAVTGACLLIERRLWEQVNGFDENLAVAFNDIDFCLKISALGYRHVVLPQVIFYHEESKSRGLDNTEAKQKRLSEEQDYLLQRWKKAILTDPFYNPHLTTRAEDFSLSSDSIYHGRSS